MNSLGLLITAVLAGMVLLLPRRCATVALFASAVFMTIGQYLVIFGLHFYVLRLLVLIGLLRILIRRERPRGAWTPVDRAMLLWAVVCIITSTFHSSAECSVVNRSGLILDTLGTYFLFRAFISTSEDLQLAIEWMLMLLVPLALAMLFEKITTRNLFADFGGVYPVAAVREGRVRAMGPFANSINAGTVAAVCSPFAVMLWKSNRRLALVSGAAILIIVYSSASSTPVVALLGALVLVWLWRLRRHVGRIMWTVAILMCLLALVMKAPIWYLIARVDIVGGSTGWFRAELISQAIEHIDEWWAYGTDITRHWMPTGITWSPEQTDITNHYVAMGVWGGLPLLAAFVFVLVRSGQEIRGAYVSAVAEDNHIAYSIWVIGAVFFTHLLCFLVISYYDQLRIFWLFLLAAICCIAQKSATGRQTALADPEMQFVEDSGVASAHYSRENCGK